MSASVPPKLRTAALAIFVLSTSVAQAAHLRIYVGTYTGSDSPSKGVYTATFDTGKGTLSAPVLAAELRNPSFLAIHPSGRFVYAVNEISEGGGRGIGAVTALSVNPDGTLKEINHQPSPGGAPCHCNVDATGTSLLVANYTGGNAVVYPINADGSLAPLACNVEFEGSSVNQNRQEASHAHSINLSSDNRFAYVADLGTDKVMIFKFDPKSHLLTPADQPSVSVTPGGGPRHFAIHPNGRFAYTNNEMTLVATAFARDPDSGGLTPIQDISTIPDKVEPHMSTAECLVHPSGKFLYVSNRGHETITAFTIDAETGLLTWVENESTLGREPRNFFIEPEGKWLLAENQNTDTIHVFAIDPATGRLSPHGQPIKVGRPVCIRALPAGQSN
jgi:6-phosphogluconolactonase